MQQSKLDNLKPKSEQSAIRNPQSAMRLVGWAVLGVVVAVVAALLFAFVMLGTPAKDLQNLTLFLLVSGGLSILLGAIGFTLRLGTPLPSLTLTMTLFDLLTPLASVRAMVEALNGGVVTGPDTVSRYLHTIQTETQHLTALIDDLFELSQIDAGALRLHLEPTSLEDLVSDALESMRAQA